MPEKEKISSITRWQEIGEAYVQQWTVFLMMMMMIKNMPSGLWLFPFL
jgi:hypothetical protein